MRQPTRNLSDKFYLVLKGMAMGTANKVPGISGGVVAYVAGFYEEFIYSFQKLNLKALKLLVAGRWRSLGYYINGKFLGLLLLGELISYFTVSLGFDVLISYYPIYVWAAFFGMILGSIYYLVRNYDNWTRQNLVILLIGAAIGIGTSLLDPAQDNANLFFVFFCGMVSVTGMTLPGLSGSYILILLGNYVLLLVDSINAFLNAMLLTLQGDLSWWNDPTQMDLVIILLVFVAGSLAGLISLSHLLGWTLKYYRDETNAMIIGFITGSLGVVWPWKQETYKLNDLGDIAFDQTGNRIVENYERYLPSMTDYQTWVALVMVGLGFVIVYLLDQYGSEKNPV